MRFDWNLHLSAHGTDRRRAKGEQSINCVDMCYQRMGLYICLLKHYMIDACIHELSWIRILVQGRTRELAYDTRVRRTQNVPSPHFVSLDGPTCICALVRALQLVVARTCPCSTIYHWQGFQFEPVCFQRSSVACRTDTEQCGILLLCLALAQEPIKAHNLFCLIDPHTESKSVWFSSVSTLGGIAWLYTLKIISRIFCMRDLASCSPRISSRHAAGALAWSFELNQTDPVHFGLKVRDFGNDTLAAQAGQRHESGRTAS